MLLCFNALFCSDGFVMAGSRERLASTIDAIAHKIGLVQNGGSWLEALCLQLGVIQLCCIIFIEGKETRKVIAVLDDDLGSRAIFDMRHRHSSKKLLELRIALLLVDFAFLLWWLC